MSYTPSHRPRDCAVRAPSRSAAAAVTETLRRYKYGKVRPMHEPTWMERWLGR